MIVFKILVVLAILALVSIRIYMILSHSRAIGTSAVKTPVMLQKTTDWLVEHVGSILLTIGGMGLLYWSFSNTQIRVTDAGNWNQEHWLSVLIIWGVIAALIALNAEKAAAQLQKVLLWVMLALLIVLPLWSWKVTPSAPAASQQAVDLGTRVAIPANGYSDHILPSLGKITRFKGHGYVIHCVYRDGTEGIVGDQARPCHDGDILYHYLKDTTGEPNEASYRYVR